MAMSISMAHAQATVQKHDVVYDVCDVLPEFPGGMGELMKFMMENIHYPKEAVKQQLEGRVVVSFIVEKNGELNDISVVKPCHPLLDEESLRLVRSMPKWKPGSHEGKPVRVSFSLPVMFRLK